MTRIRLELVQADLAKNPTSRRDDPGSSKTSWNKFNRFKIMSPRKVSHKNSGWRISTHVTLTNFSYRGPPNNVRHSWQDFSIFDEYCSLWSVCRKLAQTLNFRGRTKPSSVKYDFISNDHGPKILHGLSSSLWPVLSGFLIF